MSLDQYILTFPDIERVPCPLLSDPTQIHDIAIRPYGDYTTASKIIITVHGLTGDSLNFHYMSEFFVKQGYAIINLDILGRGESFDPESTIPKENYTYLQYIEDVVNVLRYIRQKNTNINTKWFWVGTSMGGLFGMILSSHYNELAQINIKFNALFFNDIGPIIPWDEIDRIAQYVTIDSRFQTQDEAAEYFEKIYKSHFGPKTDQAFFIHRALYALRYDPIENNYAVKYNRNGVANGLIDKSIGEMIEYPNIGQCYSFETQFNQLRVPLLVYRGETSSLLPITVLNQMEATYKTNGIDFKSITWENTGHVPPLYQTDEFVPILEWFNKY